MTPEEYKTMASEATKTGNLELALRVCKEMPNFFVGDRASLTTTWTGSLVRNLDYESCCNVCRRTLPKGIKAVWIKGQGGWCIKHYPGDPYASQS